MGLSRFAAFLIALITLSSSYAATSLSIDFSKTINTVPEFMYGTNLKNNAGNHSYDYPDGYTGIYANFTWHRQMIESAMITHLRKDMYLECNSKADGTFWHIGDCSNIDISTSQVQWAAQSGKKVLFIASYMPSWLADVSSICQSRTWSCPPTSYDRWGQLVVDFLDVVTQNGKYADSVEVEVWNEPYLCFLACDGTIQDKINVYMNLYNATYAAIKAKYPQIRVGGPSSTYGYMQGPVLSAAFFAQVDPAKVDFITMHEYGDYYLERDMKTAMDAIRAAGFGDKEVKWTEYQVSDSAVQLGNPDTYYRYLANTMMYMLNDEPTVSSMDFYQWMEPTKYSLGATYYWEYPSRFDMVSDPGLDNKLYVGFNFSRDFGTYYAAGAAIVETNTTKSNLKVIASNGSNYYFSFTDNARTAPVTINITGIDVVNVTDMYSGQTYMSNGSVLTIDPTSAPIRHFLVNLQSASAPINVSLNVTNSTNSIVNITNSTNTTMNNTIVNDTIVNDTIDLPEPPAAPPRSPPQLNQPQQQRQQTYAEYAAQYKMEDFPLIVSDGVGTALAAIVDVADLIVIAGVLSLVVLFFIKIKRSV